MYFRYTRTYRFLLFTVFFLFIYWGAAWYFSNIIIAFKTNTMEKELKTRKIKSPEQVGLKSPEQFLISVKNYNQNQIKIAAWYFPHPKAQCGVILQHGHTSRKFGMLKFAPLFYRYGCHLLMVDARYHGESEGEFCTYGYHEKHDMVQIIDWFRKKTKLPTSKIGLMGASMGGSIMLMTAAEYPKPLAFVISDSTYTNLYSILTQEAVKRYGLWIKLLFPAAEWLSNIRADFVLKNVSPEKAARKIKIPVMLIHSVDDNLIPASHSEAIYRNIPHDKKMIYFTSFGARHVLSIDMNPGEYTEKVDEFIQKFHIFR